MRRNSKGLASQALTQSLKCKQHIFTMQWYLITHKNRAIKLKLNPCWNHLIQGMTNCFQRRRLGRSPGVEVGGRMEMSGFHGWLGPLLLLVPLPTLNSETGARILFLKTTQAKWEGSRFTEDDQDRRLGNHWTTIQCSYRHPGLYGR